MPFDINDLPSGDPLEASFEDVTPVKPAEPAQPVQSMEPVVKKLDEINGNINQQQLLQTILGVPEVQEVLRARQAGQAVRVLSGNQQPQQPQQPQVEPNWEEMKDDPKKLTDTILSRLSSDVLSKLTEAVDAKLQPVMQKLQGYDSHLADQTRAQAQNEVAALRAKYDDVDVMAPIIKQVNAETNGTLKLEEAYHLAKIRSGQPMIPPRTVASERPTDSAARQSNNTPKTYAPGRRGFSAALNDALSNMKIEDMFNRD